MKSLPPYKTWIEINKDAVRNNIRAFRSILKKRTKLFAVVKSNAYGHGLEIFSGLADRPPGGGGVDGFCVDSVIEGRKLRRIGIKKPILVLGPTLPDLLKEAAADKIAVTVSNFEALKALKNNKTPLSFHLKLDTGMHRQGFYVHDLPAVIKLLKTKTYNLKPNLKGIYTHFASAKDVTYPDYTLKQISEFKKAILLLKKNGYQDFLSHAAATGGAILYPQAHFDMVRVGIGLYGSWPSRETKLQHPLIWKREIKIKPVLSWRARLSEVKFFEEGDFIGYDLSERVRKRTKAAIIPIGYWHGFPRALSAKGEVLIAGRKAKILGRVSMDLITAELPVNSKVGEMVTIIGKDRSSAITAEDFAEWANTTNYEALTRLNPLIKRIIV